MADLKRNGVFPYYEWSSATPFFDGAINIGKGALIPPPQVLPTAIELNRYEVKVIYNQEMKAVNASNPDDALNPDNYVFVPSLTIDSITKLSATEFKIKTDEHEGGENYTITISNVENLTGTVIDPLYDEASFIASVYYEPEEIVQEPLAGGSGVGAGLWDRGEDGPAWKSGIMGGDYVGSDTGSGDPSYKYSTPPSWHLVSFGKMLPPVVTDTIDVATTVAEAVAFILDAMAKALDALTSFIVGLELPDFVQELLDLIAIIREDLFATGFYFLNCFEHGYEQIMKEIASPGRNTKVKFKEFLDYMNEAYDDKGDEKRPQFNTTVVALALTVAAPTYQEFLDIFRSIAKLWPSNAEIRRILRLLEIAVTGGDVSEASVKPDWRDTNVEELFPEFAELIDEGITKIIKYLAKSKNSIEALQELITTINLKVQALNNAIQDMVDLLATLNDLLAASGIWGVFIETNKGISGIKKALLDARNRPFGDTPIFVSGCIILAGAPDIVGASADVVTVFRNLFGDI